MDRPQFRDGRPGPLHQLRQVDSDRSVADIHPAEAGDPSPATGSDHNDTAEASTPVAMTPVAVMATTLATTLAPAAGGSFGRDERGGRRWRRRWRQRKASCGSWVSPGFDRMCSHILPGPSCERPVGFDSAAAAISL